MWAKEESPIGCSCLKQRAQIHVVFHMFVLKKYERDVTSSLEDASNLWEIKERKPTAILERCMVKKNNRVVAQLLIQWN